MNRLLTSGFCALLACVAQAAVRTVSIENICGGEVTASFGPAVPATNVLVMAWGATEGGDTPASWAQSRVVGEVRPEDVEKSFALPENWGSADAQKLRLFLCDGYADAGYVTDGLVFRLDAIDNTGTGSHDSAATVWKDLAGDCDLTLTNQAVWVEEKMLKVSGVSAVADHPAPDGEMLETVFLTKARKIGGQIVFSPGRKAPDNSNTAYLICDINGSLQMTAEKGRSRSAPIPADRVAMLSGAFYASQLMRIWCDGWEVPTTYLDETWGPGASYAVVGARLPTESKYAWTGDLYAIRLYSRRLSDAEIARNHLTDMVRFFGLPSTVTATTASSVASYAKTVEVVETVYDGAGNPVAVTVAFSGVTEPAELVMAWDAADKGANPTVWANSKLVAVVHPDWKTRVFDLPSGWGNAAKSLRFFLRTGITAATYVTNELVNSWDGLNNVGTGAHDPAATVWKDLKGDLDLTLTNSAAWASDGLVVNGPSAYNDKPTSAYRTVETICTMSKPSGSVLFSAGTSSGSNLNRLILFERCGEMCYTDGSRETRYATPHVLPGERLAFSSTCASDGTVSAAMANGEQATYDANSNYWGMRDEKAIVGGRALDNADYAWYGTLHALRLYSRELTKDERLTNYRADLVRYFGVTAKADVVAAVSAAYGYVKSPIGSPDVPMVTEDLASSELFRVDLRTGAREIIHDRDFLPLVWAAANLESVDMPYTTDGLIHRWDGIDKFGTDTSYWSTNAWKDLVGNLDMKLLSGGSWGVKGLICNGPAAQATAAAPAYTTIETAYKMTSTSSRIMVTSGLTTRFVVFDWIDSNANVEEYFDGAKSTLTLKRLAAVNAMHTSAAVYSGDTVASLYSEGVKDTSGYKQTNTWGAGDGRLTIGARLSTSAKVEYPWYGEVYAIRLYNRALTDAEIANDRLVDMLRFDDKPLLSNLPNGVTVRITATEMSGEGDDLTTWTPKEGGIVTVIADGSKSGEYTWHPGKGVWRLTMEYMSGTTLLRTDATLFDLRHYKPDGTVFIFR